MSEKKACRAIGVDITGVSKAEKDDANKLLEQWMDLSQKLAGPVSICLRCTSHPMLAILLLGVFNMPRHSECASAASTCAHAPGVQSAQATNAAQA